MEIIIEDPEPLPLLSLNHISLVCNSLQLSLAFYQKVLGFVLVKRPSSFNFDGAWLFNYGVGIHLLQSETSDTEPPKKTMINPRDNHLSFQCTNIGVTEKRLQEMKIDYVKRVIEEKGIYVDQLFFHDPDGYMIEICTCENLPVVPLFPWKNNTVTSCSLKSAHPMQTISPLFRYEKNMEAIGTKRCRSEVQEETLLLDIMDIFI
uniref:VOC domain-containing protein n=1 Tax=Araucaria cunninghamii TaxID=56994 RepID=A0A0D6R366_ARACU